MTKKEEKNCWDFWECSEKNKKKCEAFKLGHGKECWLVCGKSKKEKVESPKIKFGYNWCWKCPWFKKQNPDF